MAKKPPVPRANRSPKHKSSPSRASNRKSTDAVPKNLAEQDRQGNIRQNTRNQGYQQDR
jgi:hypothetical protein